MKIDKAIEILTQLSELGIAVYDPDHIDSIKLSIEALKRVMDTNHARGYYGEYLLPGETAE